MAKERLVVLLHPFFCCTEHFFHEIAVSPFRYSSNRRVESWLCQPPALRTTPAPVRSGRIPSSIPSERKSSYLRTAKERS
jgi:hypothetical protein